MKKKLCFFLLLTISFSIFAAEKKIEPTTAKDIADYARTKIIDQIEKPCAPYVQDGYLIFTADKSARFVGIAFDYEDFRIVHPFQRLSHYEADGVPVDSVLFYVTTYPKDIDKVSYKLIIDGLWTTDPLNKERFFDKTTNSMLSVVAVEKPAPVTEKHNNGFVRFVYYGASGQSIRLGGTFNNWDSYMYELTEISPGIYQIYLPLPPGTYYYNFYNGINALLDMKNSDRAYTVDGRTASIIKVE
jgi:hypothetical protein